MFNSPIPFVKSTIVPGYYVSVKNKNNGFTDKIYKYDYDELLVALRHISSICNEETNGLETIVNIEYFASDLSYYVSTVDLSVTNVICKSLEDNYNASIMWKTSANR